MIPLEAAAAAGGDNPMIDFNGATGDPVSSVLVLPTQPTRVYMLFQNTSGDIMRFTFGTVRMPTADAGMILNPGGSIGKESMVVTTDQFNVWGPSAGQPFECYVMLA